MKVRELIAKLQEFDQNEEIWLLDNDLPVAMAPDVKVVDKQHSDYYGVKEGSIHIY